MKTPPLLLALSLLAAQTLRAQLVADGATNTLSNSSNNIPGNLVVGTNGAFTLLVLSDNALLTNSLFGNGIIGATATAKSNEVRLISPSARWLMAGTMFVGSNGALNGLVISNGATVRDGVTFLGYLAGASNNQAWVTGPESVWGNDGPVYVGFLGAGCQLLVSNAGAVFSVGQGYVGTGSSNCLAVVTGSGSVWSNSAELYVGGDRDNNQLQVSNGGAVRSGTGFVGVNATSSNNLALISGAGSMWSNALDLTIGYFSTNGNQLIVSNGATVFAGANGLLGAATNANGNSVLLTDPGTRWSVGTNLYIGSNGALSRLVVSNGAFQGDNNARLGFSLESSNNTAIITGGGSLWSNGNTLTIGNSGRGNQMIVSNGGWVNCQFGDVGGNASASNNFALVTGSGSAWSNTSSLRVGALSPGNRLVIEAGGLVRSSGATVGQSGSASNNEALVTGPDSLWIENSGLTIGSQIGFNRLVISNGAGVRSPSGGMGSISAAVSNQVVVTGTGSIWSNQATLLVGGNSVGNRANVDNGGWLACADGSVGSGFTANSNTAVFSGSGSGWNNLGTLKVGDGGSGNALIAGNGATVLSSYALIGASTSLGNNNFALLSGAGTLWSNRDDFIIGNFSVGNRLVVSNAATVVAGGDLVVGHNGSAFSNSLTVDGIGSSFIATNLFSRIHVGSNGSYNRLVVTNGGFVAGAGISIIGGGLVAAGSLGSNNEAVVTGPGSFWDAGVNFHIGDSTRGGNRLVISNSGRVLVREMGIIGAGSSTNDELVVTGPGSVWTNGTQLNVGGGSRLIVTNGGLVHAGGIGVIVGANIQTNDRVVVDGGTLRISNELTTAVLSIARGTNVLNAGLIDVDQLRLTSSQGFFEFNGGTLITRGALITNGPPFNVGTSGTTPALWDVRAGSNHFLSTFLYVGSNSSFNQMIISDGAVVTNSSFTQIGALSGAKSNSVLVTGPGTQFGGHITTGNSGDYNRLIISNGAVVRSSQFFVGLQAGADHNEMLVTGPGSSYFGQANGAIQIGASDNCTDNRLTVSDGGFVSGGMTLLSVFFSATNNQILVTGPGSTFSNATDLQIGAYGPRSLLTISNGGYVVCSNSILGNTRTLATNNLAVITGFGSVWSNSFGTIIGAAGEVNQLIVSNGATVLDCAGYLGLDASSSNNVAIVTGPGSLWSNRCIVSVGEGSRGNKLTVSTGAAVESGDVYCGEFADNNLTTVTGPGSLLRAAVSLELGHSGANNQLVVTNGARLVSSVGSIGVNTSGSNNTLVVTGTGSTWFTTNLTSIGLFGSGSRLVVSNGGSVYAGADVVLGSFTALANNRLSVDGGTLIATNAAVPATLEPRRGTNVLNAGLIEVDRLLLTNPQGFFELNGGTLITRGAVISNGLPFSVGASTTPATWDVRAGPTNHLLRGRLIVGGDSSFNQLLLTNGAVLDVDDLTLGYFTFGNEVRVSGPGSTLNSPGGLYGSGNFCRMMIDNGGKFFANGTSSAAFIGQEAGTRSNAVLVADPGSRWSVNDTIYVGLAANGNELVVSNSASVDSLSGSVGNDSLSSNNLAIVTGAGSSWSNVNELYVGKFAAGNSLVISNGGLVFAGTAVYVGFNSVSVGNRLVVDGGTLRATNVTGSSLLEIRRGTTVLNSGLIEADIVRMTNPPPGVLQFNGGTLAARSSKISSGTILSIGNGTDPATLILAGNGTHDFAGNLQTRFSSNAVLTGNGALVGVISILSGGKLIPGSGGPAPAVGKMIFTNTPSLQGTVAMEIGKNGTTVTNDQVQVVIGTLTYGGALVVSNLGPTALAAGDRFQLFNATNYAGSFSSILLPPLAPGFDWTNKLLLDGSIEVIFPPPLERFWTNVAGGNYDVAANWLSNAVPFLHDTVNFSSNANYQVAWPISALAANAVFNGGGGTVTQAIAASLWTLTNSYVIGRDSSATAAVSHISGRLNVTNSASTARLIVGQGGRGTYNLNGGEVVADTLLATNAGKSIFNLISGTLRTRSTTVNNGSQFVIGNGASRATFELLGNGAHDFSLLVSSNAILRGNGTLVGGVTVQGGGTLNPGADGLAPAFGKMIFSNAPLLQGTVIMEISKDGLVLTNDLIQAAGTLLYGGALVVSNLGPTALANGDKFQLFSATSFAVAFTSLDLPPLGPGLSWKTNLLVNGSIEVFAPPAIPLSRGSYTQNFDSLEMSGINPWRDNSTLLGWYAAKTSVPNPVTTYFASDGNGPEGSLYSFGSPGSPERALGSVASASFGDVAYGLCLTNDTANSVSNFMITYTGEQWRSAGGMSVTNTVTFWYRLSPSVLTNPEPGIATGWTPVTNLEFASPQVLGGPGVTALDGNQADNRHVFSSVLIPGLVVPPGQHVFFRWHDLNDAGFDQGIALDDLLVSFPSPAPQITSIIVSPGNGSVQIGGHGIANQTYALEAATNLNSPVLWQRLDTNIADGSGLYQFTDTNAPAFPMRFYRVLLP